MDHPVALVKMAAVQGEEDQVIPIHQLDPVLFHSIPKLKQQAVQSWWVGRTGSERCSEGKQGECPPPLM
jgi:hypothetical protein